MVPDVVSILLRAGAAVNETQDDGRTALMWAAAYNTPEIISVLLKAGADLNAKHDDGYTALMFAAAYNTPEAVSILLKAGADLNAKDKDGKTALYHAREFHNAGAVRVLEEAGKAVAKDAVASLIAAAQTGDPEAQYQLGLRYGVKQDDKKAVEWLHKAAEQGHEKAKKALALYE